MDHLQTESRNPASTRLDELSALEIVHLMNSEDAQVIPAVASQAEAIARAIDVIADRLSTGGRLIYAGAGTSGRLGVLDATECPPTFNTPPELVVGIIAGGYQALTRAVEGAEDVPEAAVKDLAGLGFGSRDVLAGIATSGRTPYVLGAAAHARSLGAFTIGLSCNPDSDLIPAVDLAITPVVGPEVLSGSTRLKAGTATKLVLNMLTTGAMVRMGKTYGNLMVDLRATNVKLRLRTNRIIRMLTSVSEGEADELLQQSNGELKTALVSKLGCVPPAEARACLQASGGRVAAALESITGMRRVASSIRRAGSEQPLLLGIDGGGTHTVALLARAAEAGKWELIGKGQGGPSNLHAAGVPGALRELDFAVAQAFKAAGLWREPAAAACLGLAGAGRPEDQEVILEWARRVHLAEVVDVTGDAAILLAAGTPEGWGLAIIAGTGSMAYAGANDGRSARAGGWGYLLGDEGSGYRLVLEALRAIARAADGLGPPTRLQERLLDQMKLKRAEEIVNAVYRGGWDRPTLAALAPVVLETAEEGDATAEAIVGTHARQLAETAASAAGKLGWERCSVPVALAGGVLLASDAYRQRVLRELAALGVTSSALSLVPEPAAGAVCLARRRLAEREGQNLARKPARP